MDESKKIDSDKIGFIKHIYDSNQQITHLADTKVHALQLINTLIISFSAAYGLRDFSFYSKMVVILAVVLAAFSSLTLLLTILPRSSKNVPEGFIFYGGIWKYCREDYCIKMTDITNEELFQNYLESIYALALIQEKKYSRLRLGLISSFIAITLVGLSIILNIFVFPK